MININEYLTKYKALIDDKEVILKLNQLGKFLDDLKTKGNRLMFFGNGASSSTASHAALDFTKQAKLTSLCFHDSAFLTAFSNDFGYENVFKEAIRHYYKNGDACIFLSVSGESLNIINAASYCKSQDIPVISFSGRSKNNSLSELSDMSFWVDSDAYNIVENIHGIWLLSMVDYLIGSDIYEVS